MLASARSSMRLAGLAINSSKSQTNTGLLLCTTRSHASSTTNSAAPPVRQAVSKEERALRRAARRERANAYLSNAGGGGAATEGTASSTTAGGATAGQTSSAGPSFDTTRLGWYAAVLIPTAFIGWGVYDEDSPPAKLSRYIGLADQIEEFSKPSRTKLLPDWNQVSGWTFDDDVHYCMKNDRYLQLLFCASPITIFLSYHLTSTINTSHIAQINTRSPTYPPTSQHHQPSSSTSKTPSSAPPGIANTDGVTQNVPEWTNF